MEEQKQIIKDLMDEHEKLLHIADQLDPTTNEYREVKKTIAQNAKDITDIQHEEAKMKQEAEELELKKKELEDAKAERRAKYILAGIGIAGAITEIVLQVKGTNHTIDRIYGYETEAILPQSKLNLALKTPKMIPIIK